MRNTNTTPDGLTKYGYAPTYNKALVERPKTQTGTFNTSPTNSYYQPKSAYTENYTDFYSGKTDTFGNDPLNNSWTDATKQSNAGTESDTKSGTESGDTSSKGSVDAGAYAAAGSTALNFANDIARQREYDGTSIFGDKRPDESAIKTNAILGTATEYGAAVLPVATQFAVSGGVYGVAIGAAIEALALSAGAIVGAVQGKKEGEEQTYSFNTQLFNKQNAYTRTQNAYDYQSYMAKQGMKMTSKTDALIRSFTDKSLLVPLFRDGGAIGAINIIPKGKLHKEKNDLGRGDKGIPVIDNDGKKLFEIEAGELITRLAISNQIEKLTYKYKESEDKEVLEELGRLVASEIVTNTDDLSGKYNEITSG